VTSTTSASTLAIAPLDVADVIALWQRCGLTRPWNNPGADIALATRGTNAAVLAGRTAASLRPSRKSARMT
jgi:hypothetical protein